MQEDDWIRNTLALASAGPTGLFVLVTVYPEPDPLNAGGMVLHYRRDEGITRSVLSTASPLAAMWQSPAGHLWVGASDGSAWTTAAVAWPGDGPAFTIAGGGPAWTTTRVPAQEDGLRPNITAVWGVSDSEVYFATASGAIYRWDGRAWSRPASGVDKSLTKLHGGGSQDAYAVGYGTTLLHWDGKAWTRLPAPGVSPLPAIVTGIAVLGTGAVYAGTHRGELLRRNGPQFDLVEKLERVRISGAAPWQDGLALSSDTGAWVYDGRALRHLMGQFSATDVQALGDRLYFIETEQAQGPSCLEYFPARTSGSPWQRIVF